jgi:hypothetical protein
MIGDLSDLEEAKRKIWVYAWVGVAASSNCTKTTACDAWADICVKQFEKRFNTGTFGTATKEDKIR